MLEFVEYQCDVCLLTFGSSSDASRHVESSDHTHASVASYHMYHCADCGIKYRDKQVMRNHSLYLCAARGGRTDQGGAPAVRLHTCGACFKTFISAEYLSAHEKLKHSSDAAPVAQSFAEEVGGERVVGGRRGVEHYPMMFDATQITNLHSGGQRPTRRPCLVPTPTVVSIPTLEQLTAGLSRFSQISDRGYAATSLLDSFARSPEDLAQGETLGSDSPASKLTPPHPTHDSLTFQQTPPHSTHDSLISKSTPPHSLHDSLSSKMTPPQSACSSPSTKRLTPPTPPPPAPPPQRRGGTAAGGASKAKGIYYKNVLMDCEGTYFCSVCKQDLSARDAKKSHRQLPCGDPKTVTYLRRYSYLCPYCRARFPSQKACREHQIAECLRQIGVSVEELSAKEMNCPLCAKKYVNLIPLKGHMTQVHKLPRSETRALLDRLGYVEEMFDRSLQSARTDSAHRLVGSEEGGAAVAETDQELSELFDFDNDVSCELASHADDVMIVESYGHCSTEMYDEDMFVGEREEGEVRPREGRACSWGRGRGVCREERWRGRCLRIVCIPLRAKVVTYVLKSMNQI